MLGAPVPVKDGLQLSPQGGPVLRRLRLRRPRLVDQEADAPRVGEIVRAPVRRSYVEHQALG